MTHIDTRQHMAAPGLTIIKSLTFDIKTGRNYQLYELTPYVFGFPQFPISVYEIQDIIREDAPLGVMLING
jgi:hypothetical protein